MRELEEEEEAWAEPPCFERKQSNAIWGGETATETDDDEGVPDSGEEPARISEINGLEILLNASEKRFVISYALPDVEKPY